ncbi:Alpha/beta hydrolase fold-1 [Gaertneriomyces semiglobifer]|nr:Alpha/beta hydrolase fold-1 [Gaertneriomyces semiglobifer]
MTRLPFTNHVVAGASPAIRISVNRYASPHVATTLLPKVNILCVHGNSMCKETWEPVIRKLFASPIGGRIRAAYALDVRNHGDSAVLNKDVAIQNQLHHFDWSDGARDVLEVANFIREGCEKNDVLVGLGHSFGGAQLLLGSVLKPRVFANFILVEPMVFNRAFFQAAYGFEDPKQVSAENDKYTQNALRRKAVFPSRQAAFENLSGKKFFRSFSEESLHIYVDHGFYEDGTGYRLKCPPHQEASVFMGCGSTFPAFDTLPELPTPALFLTGSESEWMRPFYCAPDSESPVVKDKYLAFKAPLGEYNVVPHSGHMTPLDNPNDLAEITAGYIERQLRTGVAKL